MSSEAREEAGTAGRGAETYWELNRVAGVSKAKLTIVFYLRTKSEGLSHGKPVATDKEKQSHSSSKFLLYNKLA